MKYLARVIAKSAVVMMSTAALVAGPSLSRADELSDLRADQELLQRRLDQLSQINNGWAFFKEGAPSSASFPRSFLIPGTDTSLRIGGYISMVGDYWFSGGPPNSTPQTTDLGATGQVEVVPLHVHVAPGNPARSRGTAVYSETPRQSYLAVETRTPTDWGEARTYFSFDWYGENSFLPGTARGAQGTSDPLTPRPRDLYGMLGGVLAGQARSNFGDGDATAETVDFGGNAGVPGTREPQIRYTTPLESWGLPGGSLSISAEAPDTDAVLAGPGLVGSDAGAVPGLAVTTTVTNPYTGALLTQSPVLTAPFINPTKATLPDLTAAWFILQPWGHLDFSAALRPGLQIKDGMFVDRTFVGYGVHFGGDVKPGWFGWERDDITWHFVYGDGIGRFLNASTNFALISNYPNAAPPTAAAAANIAAKTTVEWGGELGYQHRWAEDLRSTISAGINRHDIPTNLRTVSAGGTIGASPICQGTTTSAFTAAGGCALNKELATAHVNLIWSPVPFVDIAAEYLWGHRVVVSNVKGDENALISKFLVRF